MQAESLSVGGKVLDTSAVAAWTSGGLAIQSWVIVAADLGLTLYVPSLARTEVETLRPAATVLLENLTSSPQVVVGRLDPDAAHVVEKLLTDTGTFDVTAAWVVHVCRQRSWPALSADPGRLHRIDPDVQVDLV